MIEQDAIRPWLLSLVEVRTLVGSDTNARVYPVQLPQNPTLPALSYQRISATRDYVQTGATGLVLARVQIDSWAKAFRDATLLADAVRRAVSGFRGHLDGEYVHSVFLDNERHLFESGVEVYRVSQDYRIRYGEAR